MTRNWTFNGSIYYVLYLHILRFYFVGPQNRSERPGIGTIVNATLKSIFNCLVNIGLSRDGELMTRHNVSTKMKYTGCLRKIKVQCSTEKLYLSHFCHSKQKRSKPMFKYQTLIIDTSIRRLISGQSTLMVQSSIEYV